MKMKINKEKEKRITVTPQQAAEIFGASVGHLANLRSKGQGCRFFHCGRRVYYRVDHFEAWLLRNPVLTIDSIKQNNRIRGEKK